MHGAPSPLTPVSAGGSFGELTPYTYSESVRAKRVRAETEHAIEAGRRCAVLAVAELEENAQSAITVIDESVAPATDQSARAWKTLLPYMENNLRLV